MDEDAPAVSAEFDEQPRSLAEIVSYHAHIYYDPQTTRAAADRLRAEIAQRFPVRLGRWHDVHVGPHSRPMYQVAFAREVFASLVPWLMLNRRSLSILVHPNTDSPRADHVENALWLGPPLAIIVDPLPVSLRAQGEKPTMEEPNTSPTLPA